VTTTNHGVNAAVSKTRHSLSLTHPEVAFRRSRNVSRYFGCMKVILD